MKVKNIQIRLLIIFLPLIIVVLGILSGVSFYLSKQSLDQSIDETAMAVGTDYSNRVQGQVNEIMLQLDDLANEPSVKNHTDENALKQAMGNTLKRNGKIDQITFIFPNGFSIRPNGETAQLAEREYFKKVLNTKQSYVSEVIRSVTTGQLSAILCVPVLENGELKGVITGTYSLTKMTDMIKDLKFLTSGYGELIANSGMMIANPKLPETNGKLNLLEKKINPDLKTQQTELDDRLTQLFKKTVESDTQSHGAYTDVDGINREAVLTPVKLAGGQRWIMSVAVTEAEANQATNTLMRTMLIISIVCLAIAVLAIVFIAKNFSKPISLIRDECLLLAKGDLREYQTQVFTEDEIGQLAKGFREMRTKLRDLVTKVHDQSAQLAASSEELTASAEQSAQASAQVADSITAVAGSAEDQLVAVNETSVVVEEMSGSIQQVAATTSAVAEQSEQAAFKAKEGNDSVNKAVTQMVQIEQTVNTSARVVTELGERSKEIGQIVDTIAGIASQTNLLALNAAIEAARAGEQGRGFAVVAEEVRKLAEQSQEAAKQIATLINGIQGDTDKAVLAMNNGTREVKLGAEVVNAAGQSFQEIVALVTNVSVQVKEIAASIEQMDGGSGKIVRSVTKIDSLAKKTAGEAQTVSAATEEQAASMEEIAASSQSLAKLAGELQQAVGKFQV